jgi:hypothetical protein
MQTLVLYPSNRAWWRPCRVTLGKVVLYYLPQCPCLEDCQSGKLVTTPLRGQCKQLTGVLRFLRSTDAPHGWMSYWVSVTSRGGFSPRSPAVSFDIHDVSKRALQLWKSIPIYTKDIHNVFNCHNVAKHYKFDARNSVQPLLLHGDDNYRYRVSGHAPTVPHSTI